LADGKTPLELADPNVPFVYRDIMVGTQLTIIVSSDVGGYWDGALLISGADRDYGTLSGRGYSSVTLDWEGSRFDAAGDRARVYEWEDAVHDRFDLYGHRTAVPGDWYILEYTATAAGTCNVGFYDYSQPHGMELPFYELTFHHVVTRDFNEDTWVDFMDFAIFASYWQRGTCDDPEWCEGADLDSDGDVDIDDLVFFGKYWLARTAYGVDLSEASTTAEISRVGF
jgi:hypothetical protein